MSFDSERSQTKAKRTQESWCKHRIKIVSNKPGLATCKCTVCKSVGFQKYKDAKQYAELQQACKNTRIVDRTIEKHKAKSIAGGQ